MAYDMKSMTKFRLWFYFMPWLLATTSMAMSTKTIATNNETSPNPAYSTWLRQDKLIFSAIVGSLTPPIIPLLQRATTSHEAWTILANTYAKPSRGHINEQLKHVTKGSQCISEYMQFIKNRADELANSGKPLDEEDLIERILDGLDDGYKPIVDIINGRDTLISFDELHEKHINKELSLRSPLGDGA